jgi:uncharacterized repeat protein (TIGR03803 family)
VIYGTANEGADHDMGVVFRINTDGSGFSKLHDFRGTDGARPSRGLVQDGEGNFYGMTSSGGENNAGVIYTVTESGSFTTLFDFSVSSGTNPNGTFLIREDTFVPSPLPASTIENTMLRVSIHPNPSADNFNVMVSTPDAQPIQMVVTDQYGQVINTYDISAEIPVRVGSELNRGIYIMKIIQGKEITMQRMVKK